MSGIFSFFLRIIPGGFLGWGLGANDTSNIFGTAVANKIIRFWLAAAITSIFVLLGSYLEGPKTFDTVGKLFEVLAVNDVYAIALGAAISVWFFTYLRLPISTSQALVGSILSVGLLKGQNLNVARLIKIIICWITTPIGGFIIGFILYIIIRYIFSKLKYGLNFYNNFVRIGIMVVGAFGAYSLGANNVGNVTGIYAMQMPMGLSPKLWALLGGIFIAIGVVTYSKRVMLTVGTKISKLDPLMALVAILAESITIWIYTQLRVPVSTSQAIVGAVAGVGAVKSIKNIDFRTLGKIGIGWIMTPIAAGIVTALIRLIIRLLWKN
ncbi:anion permease [bacterium]|nr:anion permease [bacterium]